MKNGVCTVFLDKKSVLSKNAGNKQKRKIQGTGTTLGLVSQMQTCQRKFAKKG